MKFQNENVFKIKIKPDTALFHFYPVKSLVRLSLQFDGVFSNNVWHINSKGSLLRKTNF
jgi:hypothetical protein